MKAGYTSPSAAASVSNLDQGQLSPDALALLAVERIYTIADIEVGPVDPVGHVNGVSALEGTSAMLAGFMSIVSTKLIVRG